MVLQLTPEQEALVLSTARHEGRSVEEVVTDTLLWFARNEAENRASIERGLQQAERGEFIDDEEMERRFARMSAR